jgi:hypothetical protein
MTTRRGFLGSILALGVAPAIVRADSLMRIVPRETTIIGWGLRTSPDISAFCRVAYKNGVFVVKHIDVHEIYVSTNGYTWGRQ